MQIVPVLLMLLATAIGWGLVTNTYADWLDWQGYLLDPFGLGGKQGNWAYAALGVPIALVIGFVGQVIVSALRRDEAAYSEAPEMERV